jgi:Putative auto-transporter adhesin, head GIN domain
MKKIGILIFGLALIIGVISSFSTSFGSFSFRTPKVVGSGVIKTQLRNVVDFNEVKASGAMNVEILAGETFLVEVEADDNLIEHIITELDGETLKIYTENRLSAKSKIVVRVSMPNLKEANVSGASKMNISGIQNEDLSLRASGASKINIKGETKSLDIDISGASKIDAEALIAESVKAEASGASSAVINATQQLDADASGASKISYIGDLKDIREHTSGASSVKKFK